MRSGLWGRAHSPLPSPCVQSPGVGLPGAPRGGAWGAEGLLRPVAVERQMWAGAKPPLAGMESDPDLSFFS